MKTNFICRTLAGMALIAQFGASSCTKAAKSSGKAVHAIENSIKADTIKTLKNVVKKDSFAIHNGDSYKVI